MILESEWLATWTESGWPLFQPFLALLVALLAERLLPIPTQWDPYILFRGLARNLEARVNKPANSEQQQRISGSLSVMLMLILILPLVTTLWLFADAGWTLDCLILYLCLQWQPIRLDARTIFDNLSQGNKGYARQLLSIRMRRDTKPLSEMGIAKATIEMAAIRYFYSYVAVCLYFVLLGPIAALTYRGLFELGQAWRDRPLQINAFTQPLNLMRNGVDWPARRLWITMLRLSGNWRTTGQFVQQQRQIPRGRMPLLAAMAGLTGVNLGGPVIYAEEKVRFPRILPGREPTRCDIIPAINRLEAAGMTLLSAIGLIYATLSSLPLLV